MEFAQRKASSWIDFARFISKLSGEWIFRGQSDDWPLTTSLERTLDDWNASLTEAPKIERQMIRDFRRRYQGPDDATVNADTLYCLASMQHHGAPTRLLDYTYSPFVAAKFAIEKGPQRKCPVVWCMNVPWLYRSASEIVGEDIIRGRNVDETRIDKTFLPLFFADAPNKFVGTQNPMRLNGHLVIQQGLFLCPGDVSASFLENLKMMKDWNLGDNIVKLRLSMRMDEFTRFAAALRRMNIDSSVLFPGVEGFARSLGERLPFYISLGQRLIGEPAHQVDRDSHPL